MISLDIDRFISTRILQRELSLVQPDLDGQRHSLSAAIAGKNLLVIGGGGTIGTGFIKSALAFGPAQVVVVDVSENGLTELVRDLRSTPQLAVPKSLLTYPLSFSDPLFTKIYDYYKPFDIVANFAAHKHVRSEKDPFSIQALLQNNFLDAFKLLERVSQDRPQHFFCVSTDKAANPVNVMGASKWLMEQLMRRFTASMKCTSARFANVAFSNGSLLDGHLRRLAKRQPLSLPKDVSRYFVSPQEAGEICLLACTLGVSGDIFFPKLGNDQLKSFYDITSDLLSELGYEMDECASEAEAKAKSERLGESGNRYPAHVFLSDTSGEKLTEEFHTDGESIDLESLQSLGVVKGGSRNEQFDLEAAEKELSECFKARQPSKSEIIAILSAHIPTFRHHETGKGLDEKM